MIRYIISTVSWVCFYSNKKRLLYPLGNDASFMLESSHVSFMLFSTLNLQCHRKGKQFWNLFELIIEACCCDAHANEFIRFWKKMFGSKTEMDLINYLSVSVVKKFQTCTPLKGIQFLLALDGKLLFWYSRDVCFWILSVIY